MNTLLDYWPTPRNVADCIRTEAEAVDDAVLLAVHEPGPLITRSSTAVEARATEVDLLDALMRDASDGSAVLVAITGDSGVGKSHMVRWLHAQLQRHPRRDQLVIVLVPKTASLRQVVERILAPLKGDLYNRLLAELGQAVDHLEPAAAAAHLATALVIELDQRYNEGRNELRQAGSGNRELRERLDLTQKLRDLIREPEVLDGWFIEVLNRIVRQTIQGGSESQTGELRRIVPDDLAIPDGWSMQGSKASIQVALQHLTSNDGARRPLAAEILQDALDPALRTVFQFSKALGQRTIEEIVDEIRRGLLKDGQELVLLIEDFAALAGIQQPLLNLIIAESDHGGVRVRAPIRTALAVTDGFLPGRQTILTRAKQEWSIPNTATSPEVIIERLTDLAGRYLNAARWGIESLRTQFADRKTASGPWVETFREILSADDADRLKTFGSSRQGYPLFPLSRLSISSLCRRELRVGHELRFNPRTFINAVLRDTLHLRHLFEEHAFPPARFKGAAPPAQVALALGARGWPQDQCQRLEVVLDHWAGNPGSLSDAPQIGKGVFEAFHLPWPFAAKGIIPLPPSPLPPPAIPGQPPAAPGATEPVPQPAIEYIEAWATGDIPQAKARHVRNLLEVALNERIDWGSLRVRGRRVDIAHIWLPYARTGNPTNEPKFIAAEESRPLDPVLRAGLAALERWNAQGKSWSYPRAEDDYPLAQQLLDRLEAQVLAWHATAAERQAGMALRVLHRQALLLRLTRAVDPPTPNVSDYCAPLTKPLWNPDASDMRPHAKAAKVMRRSEEARSAVRDVLMAAVGCYQGATGSTPHALDHRRIKAAWRLEVPADGAALFKSEEARGSADDLLGRVETVLTYCRAAVESALPAIREQLGDTAEVNLGPPLLEQLEQARKVGLFGMTSTGYHEAKRAADVLTSEDARLLVRQALSFSAPDPCASAEARLAAWSSLNMEQLAAVKEALDHLAGVMNDLERVAEAQIRNLGGGDIAALLSGLRKDLDEIVAEQER